MQAINEVAEYAQMVADGVINPLRVMVMFNELEKAVKEAKESILQDAITEFEKHGGKPIIEYGFNISKSASGRYSYDNNPDWVRLSETIKELEKRMQTAYKGGGSILDESTGELIEPAIYKPNKESLTFKKQ